MSELDFKSPIDALSFAVFRAHAALIAAGDNLCAPYGMTSARWQVLGALALSPEPVTVAQVARLLGLTRQAVQRVVNDLEQAGAVTLEENPAHKRARFVVLTESGRQIYQAITADWTKISETLKAALSDTDLPGVIACLEGLKDELHRLSPPD